MSLLCNINNFLRKVYVMHATFFERGDENKEVIVVHKDTQYHR